MHVKLGLGKERRRAFRTIRKFLGGTNYRLDLMEVRIMHECSSSRLLGWGVTMLTVPRQHLALCPACDLTGLGPVTLAAKRASVYARVPSCQSTRVRYT